MFDDSSSCEKRRKNTFFPTATVTSRYVFYIIYLTEKVRQDLFGKGGRHRAQLYGGEAESDWEGEEEEEEIQTLDEDKPTF